MTLSFSQPLTAIQFLTYLYDVYVALDHAFRFWQGQPLRAKTYWQPSVEEILVI